MLPAWHQPGSSQVRLRILSPTFVQIGITIMHLGRVYTKSEWLTTMLALQVGEPGGLEGGRTAGRASGGTSSGSLPWPVSSALTAKLHAAGSSCAVHPAGVQVSDGLAGWAAAAAWWGRQPGMPQLHARRS